MRGRSSSPKVILHSQLIDVLRQSYQLAFAESSDSSCSWDFDKCTSFLRSKMLNDHIIFPSYSFQNLPIDVERNQYDMFNIMIRDLEIDLDTDDRLNESDDCKHISLLKWHFEGCKFKSSTHQNRIVFPWRGSFRYYKNSFEYPTRGIVGAWLFVFRRGSMVSIQGNDFHQSSIQIRFHESEVNRDSSDKQDAYDHFGYMNLIGNKRIHALQIFDVYSPISLTGMNEIDKLSIHQLAVSEQSEIPMVHLGPRERIDPRFDYPLHHRSLFVSLRHKAAMNHDREQEIVLNKQLDRIEYFLNKEQTTPSPRDFHIWLDYWQDRVLYGWKRWSSDFHRSWLRPLLVGVVGYLVLNALPAFFVDTFSLYTWIEFTLRPISHIPGYEAAISQLIGNNYDSVSRTDKNALRVLGILQTIWVAMWSFAFVKSVKR